MPPGVIGVIGGGTTSLVGLLDDGNILKYPIVKGECANELDVEAAIYERLGNHPRIIGFLGRSEHGLKLERGMRLTDCLDSIDEVDLKIRWPRQLAEGVSFLHSHGVIHCDLHPDNLLLDNQKNIKICDFQGKMDGFDGAALERVRYCLPRIDLHPSVQSDIFALGSTIFRIFTGNDPYHDISDTDVPLKYEELDFPATNFVAGAQVLRCWQQKYSCADQVVNELASLVLMDD